MRLWGKWLMRVLVFVCLLGFSLLTQSSAFARQCFDDTCSLPPAVSPPVVEGCYLQLPIATASGSAPGYTIYSDVEGYYDASTHTFCHEVVTFTKVTPENGAPAATLDASVILSGSSNPDNGGSEALGFSHSDIQDTETGNTAILLYSQVVYVPDTTYVCANAQFTESISSPTGFFATSNCVIPT